MKNCDNFLIFTQNIDPGYLLEPPYGSNDHPQSMFYSKNKNNIAKSEQSSHTPGGSYQRPYHFNLLERTKMDK